MKDFAVSLFGLASKVDPAGSPVIQLTQRAAQRAAGKAMNEADFQSLVTGREGKSIASKGFRDGMAEAEMLMAKDTFVPSPSAQQLSAIFSPGRPYDGPLSSLASGGIPPPKGMLAHEAFQVIQKAEDALLHGHVIPSEVNGVRRLVESAHDEILAVIGQVGQAGPPGNLMSQAHEVYAATRREYAQRMGLMDVMKTAWTTEGKFDPNLPRMMLNDSKMRTSIEQRFMPDPRRTLTNPVDHAEGTRLYRELQDILRQGPTTGVGERGFVEGAFGMGGSMGSSGNARAFPQIRLPRAPGVNAKGGTHIGGPIPRGMLGPPLQATSNE